MKRKKHKKLDEEKISKVIIISGERERESLIKEKSKFVWH